MTVDAKQAVFRQDGYTFNLFDLPGTYSITEYTPEELYVRRHILDAMPDVVINVLDASNLERNLFLTTQLIDMDLKVVIALNMYDELEKSGLKLDYRNLGRMIGIPIVPTVASRGEGIRELFKTVIDVFEDNEPIVRHIHINYGKDIEHSIRLLQDEIWKNTDLVARYSSRYLAIKLLCNDKNGYEVVEPAANFAEISAVAEHERQKLERQYKDSVETIITDAKFGFIAGALEETCQGINLRKNRPDDRVDRIMTHKVWGLPIFLLIMWIMFQTTFSLGGIPAGWLEAGVEWLGDFIGGIMQEGPLREPDRQRNHQRSGGRDRFPAEHPDPVLFYLADGRYRLHGTGGFHHGQTDAQDRTARQIVHSAADGLRLQRSGHHGHAHARKPKRPADDHADHSVHVVQRPAAGLRPADLRLFPSNQGLVLFSIYLIGILIAIGSSILFKKLLFAKAEAPFVMELPPYRIPTTRNVVRHMWSKGSQYLRKMGTVILAASIIIWALGYYPRNVEYSVDYDRVAAEIVSSGLSSEDEQAKLQELNDIRHAEHQKQSYIGKIGHFIEPAIRPLGFDWQIGISLFSGLAAKEIVVSTMAVLSNSGDDDASLAENLQKQIYTQGDKAGQPVYSPLVAYTLMLFILLYVPCIAAIVAIRREAGRKWAALSVVYSTGLAWLLSFAVYQIGRLAIKHGKYAGNHYGNHHRGGVRLHAVLHLPVEQTERVRMRMRMRLLR